MLASQTLEESFDPAPAHLKFQLGCQVSRAVVARSELANFEQSELPDTERDLPCSQDYPGGVRG